MKTYNTFKNITISFGLVLLVACSTKKNKFVNRNFQALNTKYNVMYHGDVALEKGILDLKSQYKDNFWETLPVERLQIAEVAPLPGEKNKNANFDRAEEKATKAIQKRSMNIDGVERNYQIDEAYLLLGKARYYEQRFIPALEAFNYILYKYPECNLINTAKIWREKTNMRLDNDELAIKNLNKLLKEIKFKDQVFADANATLAQAFLNTNQKDSAIVKIKLAEEFTKSKEEKARYRYIKGQLYESLNKKDSARMAFQSIIDMKRKSPKPYSIHAEAKVSELFDYEKGDTILFLEKYKKLLADRENRPYLDQLNHQLALFYDARKKQKQAVYFYKKSLRAKSEDQYLMASNYRNLAKIYFDFAKYQTAGKYYDSTLTKLTPKTREYNSIKKKRENLEDVIKYENIAQRNDSILNVVALSESDKKGFYQDYINKLKKADELKAKLEKQAKEKAEILARQDGGADKIEPISDNFKMKNQDDFSAPTSFIPKTTSADGSNFYFYNSSTVAYGKLEFKKKWGNRIYKQNWRMSLDQLKSEQTDSSDNITDVVDNVTDTNKSTAEKPEYTTDFYIKKLPTNKKAIDSLAKERNFAYYQLGYIYKEKFKEYKLAASKLEQLLENKPEERLVLPSMYNLFKIYEIIDKDKAEAMKNRIIAEYPNSRYAQILSNPNGATKTEGTPEEKYASLYDLYSKNKLFEVLDQVNVALDQYQGEEISPKLDLLKAHVVGKLKGVAEYKTALNFVALNYPNKDEGKESEKLLAERIPVLENLKFYEAKPNSWKIIYAFKYTDSLSKKALFDKVTKFATERTIEKLKTSKDIYNMTDGFIVIHGFKTEESAKGAASVLKEYKDYKIEDVATVISNENYAIVQIKKNFEVYLTTPKSEPKVAQPEPVAPTKVEKQSTNTNQQKINNQPKSIENIQQQKSLENALPPNNSNSPQEAIPMQLEKDNIKKIQEKKP